MTVLVLTVYKVICYWEAEGLSRMYLAAKLTVPYHATPMTY